MRRKWWIDFGKPFSTALESKFDSRSDRFADNERCCNHLWVMTTFPSRSNNKQCIEYFFNPMGICASNIRIEKRLSDVIIAVVVIERLHRVAQACYFTQSFLSSCHILSAIGIAGAIGGFIKKCAEVRQPWIFPRMPFSKCFQRMKSSIKNVFRASKTARLKQNKNSLQRIHQNKEHPQYISLFEW